MLPHGCMQNLHCKCTQADISAGKMIFNVENVDPSRRARLIKMLDIDIYQRLTTMSDGQRRRVQICMGLLKPYDVSWILICPSKEVCWTFASTHQVIYGAASMSCTQLCLHPRLDSSICKALHLNIAMSTSTMPS
jgi:hypothetical protein